ncbi:hypothetical protein DYB36_001753 [Aphanomyces astaci]|uniref:Uncharacterized protein n=1 Tax=Aphanomyces astaci TaxID=112090 RepID=A0A397AWG7_APHAT|nr:hypothetical protein DYB36_001753 [Aphanomyces astaci]
MDLLLYVHVDEDHFVIQSTAQETILDVIQRSEAAYASLFRMKPPLTIDAMKNDEGCFLPSSLCVGQILRECNGAHVYVAMHSPGPPTDNLTDDIPRLCATWGQWQIEDSTTLFLQLLSSKRVLNEPTLLTYVLELIDAFARSSREAQLSLVALDINTRLLHISDTHHPHIKSAIEPIIATLHALSFRQRHKPVSPSATSPPPMAVQELLFCMHGKQRHSQDVATQQLLLLSESRDAWRAAVNGADGPLFAELLHLATTTTTPTDTSFAETLLTRVLQTMVNVISFQPDILLVPDPNAIDSLVAIGQPAAYSEPITSLAATVLRHVLERQGHLGYTNVAGLVGLLQSSAQSVGAAALLAALDGKAKVNPSHTHDMVLHEMSTCHVPALVDAMYVSDVPTRVAVLQVLNVLLQDDDVRQLVVADLGCIPAFVSIFLDIGAIEGQRQAAKQAASRTDSKTVVASPGGDNTGGGASFQTSNRKCTDILCTLLFVVFWAGMIAISVVAFTRGKPERLAYGMDFKGRVCGTSGTTPGATAAPYDLTAYKYLAFPRLAQDLNAIALDPNFTPTDPNNLKKLYGVCVASCPTSRTDTGAPQYVHSLVSYGTAGADAVSARNASYGAALEDTTAGSPFRVFVNTSNGKGISVQRAYSFSSTLIRVYDGDLVLFRCLEIPSETKVSYVRCVDDCTAGSDPTMCGSNATFFPCGAKGCTAYATANLPTCMNLQTKSETYMTSSANNSPVFDSLTSGWFMVAQWIGDIQKAAGPILICGVAVALVLGFVWLFCLRYCAGFFVWLTILLVVAILLVATFFLAYKGELLNNSMIASNLAMTGMSADAITELTTDLTSASAAVNFAAAQVKYWKYAAYIFIGVDVLVLLVLIFMCSRIQIAVGIIREASKAIGRMPFLVLFPLVPVVSITAFVIYWIIAAAFLATAGKVSVVDVAATVNVANATTAANQLLLEQQYSFQDDNVLNYLLAYHVFGFLWTAQFLQAVGYTTMAGAVCEYYWTLNKSVRRSVFAVFWMVCTNVECPWQTMGRVPILRSFYRTLRYHLGSMAFGSLIIAIIQFIRLVLEYVDQKLKTAQKGNTMVKVAMCAFKCCLWCFEKCMKFLNKYVMSSCTSFCSAMKESFGLILANAARVATVSIVSMFLILLGKIFITSFCCMMLFLFLSHPPAGLPSFFTDNLDNLSSPVFPLLVCGLLSFTIASFFLDVYETAIDTILLCFCEDCKVNQASGTYFMSDELLAYVDGAAKKHAFDHFKQVEA